MHDATFSKEQLLRLKVATCLEMADQAAVEQVQSLRCYPNFNLKVPLQSLVVARDGRGRPSSGLRRHALVALKRFVAVK